MKAGDVSSGIEQVSHEYYSFNEYLYCVRAFLTRFDAVKGLRDKSCYSLFPHPIVMIFFPAVPQKFLTS